MASLLKVDFKNIIDEVLYDVFEKKEREKKEEEKKRNLRESCPRRVTLQKQLMSI